MKQLYKAWMAIFTENKNIEIIFEHIVVGDHILCFLFYLYLHTNANVNTSKS